ncbi:MAG: tRNA lysidine(34) synthetase TilS [Oscillospiraceae bacterium]|nr:tRNA lysidine(34) synthetase TilS [Oscillospiraceae bacterium]
MQIVNKILQVVEQYSMVKHGDVVTVGLSGGADSVALLYSLIGLSGELGIDVRACHLNHNLRGEESERDERFVRELCDKLKTPLVVKSVDIKSLKRKHQSIETAAREERYSFFQELSHTKIATAHNADDNAETLLFNLSRGSALKGLCGIPPLRGNIIRPLIYCERAEIENYCAENDLDYVTDSSNFSDEFTRNRIRSRIVPLLKELNPNLLSGINRMTDTLRRDEEFISSLAVQTMKEALVLVSENSAQVEESGYKYRIDVLNAAPAVVTKRIISMILSQNNISPEHISIEGINGILAAGKGKINIKKNVFAVVKKNCFYIENVVQHYRR